MASAPSKTVVVLGASYGGARAAQVIAAGLPDGWRLVLIDRNSHLNHVYILPRLAVLPGYEHKAFIPYDYIFNPGPSMNRCAFIQATILALTPHSITLSRAVPELGVGADSVLGFEYAVYALGSRMPEPLDLWDTSAASNTCTSHSDAPPHANANNAINGHAKQAVMHAPYGGTKAEGIAWLKRKQRIVEEAVSVLVVGGGALGIQFASDIAAVHPTKRVTLLHSRGRLLPRFGGSAGSVGGGEEGAARDGGEGEEGEGGGGMHGEILRALHALNVHVVLGERVDLSSLGLAPSSDSASDSDSAAGQRTVRTTTGREIGADLVLLCTGQTPNTALLRALDPRVVDPVSGLARVGRGMQLAFVPAPPTEGGDHRRGEARQECAEDRRGSAPPPIEGRDAGAGIQTKKGAEEEAAPAHADTTDHGDAEDGKDSACLLAAALADIELLDTEGVTESSSSSDNLEAESLALEADASRSHSLANEQVADPSPSASSASSPASPSHSLVNEQDKDAEPVLTPKADEDEEQTTPYPHIFAIGDAADAFGALPAGHNAWAQGEVAGRNVLRLISRYGGNAITGEGEGEKSDEFLETYTPGPPAIKVSLGSFLVLCPFYLPPSPSPSHPLLPLPHLFPLPPFRSLPLLPLLSFLLPHGSGR
ncbi:hypothetical protein B0H13DRAFT_2274944 [Mycena leptocephala]|nr:hypothetical protein B0H13DRAFT_2274944 [Mycena leptocephala]